MVKCSAGIIPARPSEDKELQRDGDDRNMIHVYIIKYLYFTYTDRSL